MKKTGGYSPPLIRTHFKNAIVIIQKNFHLVNGFSKIFLKHENPEPKKNTCREEEPRYRKRFFARPLALSPRVADTKFVRRFSCTH